MATGAWRRRDDVEVFGTRRTAEVKRMYVAPAARGLGVARRMLARLEESAAAADAEAMILETGTAQPEAMALYESSGYARIENFGHYRWSPQNRCYGKLLRVPWIQVPLDTGPLDPGPGDLDARPLAEAAEPLQVTRAELGAADVVLVHQLA